MASWGRSMVPPNHFRKNAASGLPKVWLRSKGKNACDPDRCRPFGSAKGWLRLVGHGGGRFFTQHVAVGKARQSERLNQVGRLSRVDHFRDANSGGRGGLETISPP